jgi:hypothetical protein
MHVDPTQLAPNRTAALRRWLQAANARLLSLQRQQQELVATAKSLLEHVEPARTKKVRPKPGLASRLAR